MRCSAPPAVRLASACAACRLERLALALDSIGYAEVARASYPRFAYLKEEGIISEECRFQVSLPTPMGGGGHSDAGAPRAHG